MPKVSDEKSNIKIDEPSTPNNCVSEKEEQANSISFVCLDDSSKSLSMMADSEESQSAHSVSTAEDEEGNEMNVSHTSQTSLKDQNKVSTSAKKMTPKQFELEKKRMEKLKEKEVLITLNYILLLVHFI